MNNYHIITKKNLIVILTITEIMNFYYYIFASFGSLMMVNYRHVNKWI